MFAIYGAKLPTNANNERSSTHAKLLHRVRRLEKVVDEIVSPHHKQDSRAGASGDQALEARR